MFFVVVFYNRGLTFNNSVLCTNFVIIEILFYRPIVFVGEIGRSPDIVNGNNRLECIETQSKIETPNLIY